MKDQNTEELEGGELLSDLPLGETESANAESRRSTELNRTLMEIGEKIHFNRKSHKMSQQKLSRASGLDRAYISSLENGKQNITIGALLKLSAALGVALRDLITGPHVTGQGN